MPLPGNRAPAHPPRHRRAAQAPRQGRSHRYRCPMRSSPQATPACRAKAPALLRDGGPPRARCGLLALHLGCIAGHLGSSPAASAQWAGSQGTDNPNGPRQKPRSARMPQSSAAFPSASGHSQSRRKQCAQPERGSRCCRRCSTARRKRNAGAEAKTPANRPMGNASICTLAAGSHLDYESPNTPATTSLGSRHSASRRP
mmetsp:Transcript_76427/g.221952  ORF Transcript_76427/g.221952 Transcript_76427/m.221952 type:complete len:200 (-) Transcript_76427:381-980(-)